MKKIEVKRYSCGRCNTVYDSEDRASLCFARHLAQDVWNATESSEMDSTPIDSQLHTSTSEQYSGQRQTPWTEDTVDILLRAVRDAFPRLDGKLEKRDRVWRDIFAVVSSQPHHVDLLTLVVPGATMQQCKVKWKNLRYAFMRYIENMKTTGARKLHVPQGYDLLYSFLGERPITHPRTERCGLENEQLRDALVTGTTTIKTVTPVAGASGVSRIVTNVAGPSGVSRADTPVAGPSGVSRIVTPVAGPSGVSRADTPVAGPSGVSRIVTQLQDHQVSAELTLLLQDHQVSAELPLLHQCLILMTRHHY
ncbi:uncharacterized protein LOC123517941 [Portunus trituberculatus]|uniref:uncharacterized protein LOC123517941 n=1 Tax=Portunus trituberculatus TaxID=210409 RepID=UPI001E1CE5B9|nr:uncharacterized protein LOC123517941 [Portunus trituberculatus]